MAEQHSSYLANCFNRYYKDAAADAPLPPPGPVTPAAMPFHALEVFDRLFKATPHFRYIERGAMVSMGFGGGIADLTKSGLGTPTLALPPSSPGGAHT